MESWEGGAATNKFGGRLIDKVGDDNAATGRLMFDRTVKGPVRDKRAHDPEFFINSKNIFDFITTKKHYRFVI